MVKNMENQIKELMQDSLTSIKEMIDGNKIMSNPITVDGKIIITVSKIKVGFASGGTEQKVSSKSQEMKVPFGGGAGGSLSITPVAFLIVDGKVELHHLDDKTHILEKLIDEVSDLKGLFGKKEYDEEIVKVIK